MSLAQLIDLPDVYVGDTGPPLEFPILDSDGYTVRNLTNYTAQLSFWYNNTNPHWVWGATVFTTNPGVIRYFYTGNEYTQVGIINIQVTLNMIEWGTNTNGRGFVEVGCPIMQRRVLARPQ